MVEGFRGMTQVQPYRFLLRNPASLAYSSESRFPTSQSRSAQVGARMNPTNQLMHRQPSGGTMA